MNYTETDPDIPIVYEDNHLLVVDKPHNLLSQEDHTGDPDLLTLCKEYLNKKHNTSGNIYLGLIHRLDRPVGGLMLLAKSPKAAGRLSEQIRNRTLQKTYWTVVEGMPPENGLLTHHLLKDSSTNTVSAVDPDTPGAKEAILSFKKLESADGLALLAVHLQTGRPHQIRVQLAEEGYPILGDYKYGDPQQEGKTIALRSVELVVVHPTKKEELRFHLPPPDRQPWIRFSKTKSERNQHYS